MDFIGPNGPKWNESIELDQIKMNRPNWTEVDQMDWSVSNYTEMDQSLPKWKWIEVVQTRSNGPKWTETDQTKLKCYTDLFQ